MAKTDRATFGDFPGYTEDDHVGRYKPWKYQSATGWSKPAKMHKALKRAKHKANRRADIPQTGMRGYGWARDNYKTWND